MKRWNIVLMMTLLLLSVWTLSSCSNKMMPVNTLRRLSTNMELKGDMYTLKDWNRAKDKYVTANQRILKHRSEYTAEELAEIAVLQGKCITGFSKGVTQSTARSVGAVTTGVKSVVDEIKELIDAFSKKKEKEE
jgi:hypothetical protein